MLKNALDSSLLNNNVVSLTAPPPKPSTPKKIILPENSLARLTAEFQMCGEDGADSEVCLDGCSGYEALIDDDDFAYRYYTVNN